MESGMQGVVNTEIVLNNFLGSFEGLEHLGVYLLLDITLESDADKFDTLRTVTIQYIDSLISDFDSFVYMAHF